MVHHNNMYCLKTAYATTHSIQIVLQECHTKVRYRLLMTKIILYYVLTQDHQKQRLHVLCYTRCYTCVEYVSLECVNCHIMFALVVAASEIKRVTIQLSLKDEQFSETLQDKTSEPHKTLKRNVVSAVRVVVQ